MTVTSKKLQQLKDTMKELLDQPKLSRRHEVKFIVEVIDECERRGAVLHRLAKGYMTTRELKKDCGKDYGLEYTEALEMAYENMQAEAKAAISKARGPTVKKR